MFDVDRTIYELIEALKSRCSSDRHFHEAYIEGLVDSIYEEYVQAKPGYYRELRMSEGVIKHVCFIDRIALIPPETRIVAMGAIASLIDIDVLIFPGSVETVDERVFRKTNNIGTVIFVSPSVDFFSRAFSNVQVREVYLPSEQRVIPSWLFNSCTKLRKVHMSQKVMRIEERAFNYCENLEYISPGNPDVYVAFNAFYPPCAAYNMEIEGSRFLIFGNTLYGSGRGNKMLKIPEGVEIINGGSSPGGSSTDHVIYPSSISLIRYNGINYSGGFRRIDIESDHVKFSDCSLFLDGFLEELNSASPIPEKAVYSVFNPPVLLKTKTFENLPPFLQIPAIRQMALSSEDELGLHKDAICERAEYFADVFAEKDVFPVAVKKRVINKDLAMTLIDRFSDIQDAESIAIMLDYIHNELE